MKKYLRYLFFMTSLLMLLFVGCGNGDEMEQDTQDDQNVDDDADADTDTDTGDDQADTVTSPSVVTDQESLMKATSSDGSWIIIFTEDLSVDEEIVVEGEFTKPDREDSSQLVPTGRKFALYAQDENRNKTESYTLEAPSMIVRSEDTRIQGGTFRGDVYVEANGFKIVDGEVDGNVYFVNEEYESTFSIDNGGSVTGTSMVKEKEEE